jgi:hypothetical protein
MKKKTKRRDKKKLKNEYIYRTTVYIKLYIVQSNRIFENNYITQ